MIEYLKIEIAPYNFVDTEARELKIIIETNQPPYRVEKREIRHSDELTSFFDQIFDCAKREILQLLKESRKVNNEQVATTISHN